MNAITQVKQWGNSKALRLPTDFARLMNLNIGENIELRKINEKTIQLVILDKPKKQRLTLAERIKLTKADKLQPINDWDNLVPIGKEI
ncbi:antitoxin MazE [Rodentibacter rarus]|uniref:Antitoxin MazE n=1 Tax=Rodentibacter rarus TaxID=1908260 RepID=A0A1V3IIA0_9PAST|nr:antitoxin MazE [Rodentibacter rarus]OOF41009.1 antitoxin MazE [Rodentibacter rarus]